MLASLFFYIFYFVGLEILTGDCLHSETVALRLMPLHLFLLPSRRVFVLFFIKYRLPIVIDLALFLSFLLYRVTLLEVYIYIRKHKSQPSAKKEKERRKEKKTHHKTPKRATGDDFPWLPPPLYLRFGAFAVVCFSLTFPSLLLHRPKRKEKSPLGS